MNALAGYESNPAAADTEPSFRLQQNPPFACLFTNRSDTLSQQEATSTATHAMHAYILLRSSHVPVRTRQATRESTEFQSALGEQGVMVPGTQRSAYLRNPEKAFLETAATPDDGLRESKRLWPMYASDYAYLSDM
eukprot:scaffold162867_cov43-Prasinocladus_malaysianus.AAC.1